MIVKPLHHVFQNHFWGCHKVVNYFSNPLPSNSTWLFHFPGDPNKQVRKASQCPSHLPPNPPMSPYRSILCHIIYMHSYSPLNSFSHSAKGLKKLILFSCLSFSIAWKFHLPTSKSATNNCTSTPHAFAQLPGIYKFCIKLQFSQWLNWKEPQRRPQIL